MRKIYVEDFIALTARFISVFHRALMLIASSLAMLCSSQLNKYVNRDKQSLNDRPTYFAARSHLIFLFFSFRN